MASEALPLTGGLPLSPQGKDIIIVHVVFLVLTTLAFVLRVWSKTIVRAPWHLEDWFVAAALLIFYGYTGCSISGVVDGGIGYHLLELESTPWRLTVILKTSLANEFTYATGVGLVKVSVCLLLARIFQVKQFRILAYVAMVSCIAWAVMTILIGFFICTPLAFNWDKSIKNGHCGNQNIGYAFVGVIDIITDLFILVLPQHMIWKLHLPKANRIALAVLFALGSATIALSILRVIVLLNVNFADFPFSIKYTEIYTIAEFGTAIIISCGPLIRPIFDKIFKGTVSRLRYGTGGGTSRVKTIPLNSENASHGFSVLDDGDVPLKDIPGAMGKDAPRVTTQIVANRADSRDEEMDFGFDHSDGSNSGGSEKYSNHNVRNAIVVRTDTRTVSEL